MLYWLYLNLERMFSIDNDLKGKLERFFKFYLFNKIPVLNQYCESILGLSSPVRKALISGGLSLRLIKMIECG